jgi:hypothetical protein
LEKVAGLFLDHMWRAMGEAQYSNNPTYAIVDTVGKQSSCYSALCYNNKMLSVVMSIFLTIWPILGVAPDKDLFLFPWPEPRNSVAASGFWSRYDREPTDATIEYRKISQDLPQDMIGYDGVIATISCDHIGKDAWITIGESDWLKVRVFDCSGHMSTNLWAEENNIIGELGYYIAKDHGFTFLGSVPSKITFSPPGYP